MMDDHERQQLEELHDFFMKPAIKGKPSRAEQIDDILATVRTGKMSVRAFLWVCGAIVAMVAAYNALKGWRP